MKQLPPGLLPVGFDRCHWLSTQGWSKDLNLWIKLLEKTSICAAGFKIKSSKCTCGIVLLLSKWSLSPTVRFTISYDILREAYHRSKSRYVFIFWEFRRFLYISLLRVKLLLVSFNVNKLTVNPSLIQTVNSRLPNNPRGGVHAFNWH